MTWKQRSWSGYLVVVLAFGLILTACGGDDGGTDTTATDDTTETTDTETTDTETTDTEVAGGEEIEATYENPADGVFVDRIDYGLIYDQTGPTAATQVPFAHGILTVFERVNNEGGINGRSINVISEDEQYDAAVGAAAYNKLVNETPVVGLTGASNSSFQLAIIEDVDANGVPVIGAQSTSEAAVNPFRDYFFAMECTYADQADVAVAYAFDIAGTDNPEVVTFVLNVASGTEYADLVTERVEAAGGSVVGEFVMEPGAQDADAQTQDILRLDPDVIFLHGGTASAIPTLNSFNKFSLTDTPIIGIFAQKVPAVATAQPSITDQWSAVHCYAAANEGVEIGDQLIADAQAAGYSEEEYLSSDFSNGYAVGLVVVEALARAGDELNRETLKAALESLDGFSTGGLSPDVSFGPDDRIGVEGVVPFVFDESSSAYLPVGTFEEWAGCITNQYLAGNIDSFDVACAAS